MGRGTVIPRDPHPRRRGPRVRAMAREPAAALGMPRTVQQPCLLPGTFGNIGLAGQRAWIAQLHRPGGARRSPWRIPPPSPSLVAWTAGKVLTTTCARECADGCSYPNGGPGLRGGARRHPQTRIGAPLEAAERLQALHPPLTSRSGGSTLLARPTLRPAIGTFLTGRVREELSEGLRNYVRANKGDTTVISFSPVVQHAPPDASGRRHRVEPLGSRLTVSVHHVKGHRTRRQSC